MHDPQEGPEEVTGETDVEARKDLKGSFDQDGATLLASGKWNRV
jgi:hypothetical protein